MPTDDIITDDMYADITKMQEEHQRSWRDKERWIIIEEDDGTYSIHVHSKNGVAPMVTKPNKRSVAARLLQLLQIGPVAPQDYPEEICVTMLAHKSGEVIPFKQDS